MALTNSLKRRHMLTICFTALFFIFSFLVVSSSKSILYSLESPVDAVVTEVIIEKASDGKKRARYYVSFNDGTKAVTAISSMSEWPPSYGQGSTVSILYRKENPGIFYFNSFIGLWLLPMVLMIVVILISALLTRILALPGDKGARRAPG